MSRNNATDDRPAPLNLVHIEGQTAEAGLCIDGLCVLPTTESTALQPPPARSARNPEAHKPSPPSGPASSS